MIYQCPKCGLSKSNGVMNSILPQCKCDWGAPAAQPDMAWIERERAVGYREGHMAALAQRQWVGLTDEDKVALSEDAEGNTWVAAELTEAKLKEKNT